MSENLSHSLSKPEWWVQELTSWSTSFMSRVHVHSLYCNIFEELTWKGRCLVYCQKLSCTRYSFWSPGHRASWNNCLSVFANLDDTEPLQRSSARLYKCSKLIGVVVLTNAYDNLVTAYLGVWWKHFQACSKEKELRVGCIPISNTTLCVIVQEFIIMQDSTWSFGAVMLWGAISDYWHFGKEDSR